jgi:hypothetical protein
MTLSGDGLKRGEKIMRMVAGVVAAAAAMGAASLAYAATDAGTITDINQAKDSITLRDGSTFMAPKDARLSNLRIGEKVTVAYTQLGDMKDATKITPVPLANADLGG